MRIPECLSLLAMLAVAVVPTVARGQDNRDQSKSEQNSSGKAGGDQKDASPNTDKHGLPTADSQKMNSSDREITRNIRRAIVEDKNLSSSAKNVKVISRDGKVTLRGRVNSEEEKAAIEQKAVTVAGTGSVTNMIEVKNSNNNQSGADRSKNKDNSDAHDVSAGGENDQQNKK